VRVKKWIYTLLTVCLILPGCRENRETIIPKKQLVEMMVDMYICDALAMNNFLCSQLGGLDSTAIYSSLTAKYKYTKKDLAYTLKYYSTKPKKLTLIYDQVFAELSKKADDAKIIADKYSYNNLQSIWSFKDKVNIDADTTSYPTGFDVPLDTTGTFVISAQIKMSVEDQSINPCITAYFFNPKLAIKSERFYFKKTPIFKSNFSRDFQIIEKNDNPKLTHLFIIIPEQQNTDSIFHKSLTITNFTVSLYKNKSDTSNLK
jgi:hypothetical protein